MKEESRTEKESKYLMIASISFKIMDTLKPFLLVLGIGHFANEIVKNLAGKETVANIVLNLISDIKFTASLAVTGICGAGWYRTEKKYKRTIERLSNENIELRKALDKERGSSMLSKDGKTNRKDMIL